MIGALTAAIRSRMVREGGELAIGTAIGQLLPAVAAPALARLYTPAQFGVFALFAGVVSIVSVVAGGRYELGILIPKTDVEGLRVATVSGLLVAATSVVVLLVGIGIHVAVPSGPSLFFVSAAVLAVGGAGLYQSLGYWMIRKRRFRELSIHRAGRGAMVAVTSIAFALFGDPATGLILSLAVTYIGTSLVMGLRICWVDWPQIRDLGGRDALRDSARTYVDFARFSVLADMMNAISQQLPTIILTRGFGAAAAGQLALAQRALGAPLGIVSVAIGDVFKEHAAREYRETGASLQSWKSASTLLGAAAVLLFLLVWIAGPRGFLLLMGPEWATAGDLVRLLAPYYALPLSRILYVVQWQRKDLAWQAALLLVLSIGLTLNARVGTLQSAVGTFSLSYSLLYLVYFAMARRAARGDAA